MKLNIVTILLFTVLLSTGLSTKADAQCWRCHRYGFWAPEHATDTAHCAWGHCGWGCRPWRYHRMCWDSKCCPAMAERFKEDSAYFSKMHADMKEAHHKFCEDGKAMNEKCTHGCWGHGWGWGRPWRYERYYYRGAGY